MDFESVCLRPIIVCLRFIGVDVGSTVDGNGQTKTTIRRSLSHFYAFFCLVFNIGFNIYCRLGDLIFFDVFASETTTAYDAFLSMNSFTTYIGNHLILLFYVSPRFAVVLQSFRLVQNQIIDERLFLKVKRFSIVCVSIHQIVVLIYDRLLL